MNANYFPKRSEKMATKGTKNTEITKKTNSGFPLVLLLMKNVKIKASSDFTKTEVPARTGKIKDDEERNVSQQAKVRSPSFAK